MTGFGPALEDGPSDDPTARWAGVAKILGPRWAQLPNLTLGLLGVQLMWSVEMSYGSPYLVSLGLPKALMAVVFIAGPLSGLVVQPVIGLLADNSKSRFGRRRPFILGGVVLCALALLLLGFTRQVASIVTSIPSAANDGLTVWLAILSIFCIDFGINAVQSMDRALIVDTLPPSDQPSGNAWAARMLGLGSVGGFFFGGVDMTKVLPFLGKTELQVLSVVGAFLLVGTHLVTAGSVQERVLLSSRRAQKSFIGEVKATWETFRSLPHTILQICMIQFFAWLGWFPVLFYTSLYIGELYRRSIPSDSSLSSDFIDAEANRLGSRTLLYSAFVTLVTNFLAPVLVSEKRAERGSSEGLGRKPWYRRKMHLATLWAFSHALFAACMFGTFLTGSVAGATILMTITGFSWGITQWAPYSLLAEAILTSSTPSADPLDDAQVILLVDHRTSREDIFAVADEDNGDDDNEVNELTAKPFPPHREWSDDEADDDTTPEARDQLGLLSNTEARQSWVDVGDVAGHEEPDAVPAPPRSELGSKAGIVLGIHNMFIVIPQFLVTGMASIIFAILEPGKSVLHHPSQNVPALNANATTVDVAESLAAMLCRDAGAAQAEAPHGPIAVAIIFRLGGLAAIVASVVCWRLASHLRRRG